jgi:ribosomal protein S18 acetylase RimI-like enzyme
MVKMGVRDFDGRSYGKEMPMAPTFICTQYSIISDTALGHSLWSTYLAAFTDAATACIQDQICYSPETFADALTDPDYVKFVVTDGTEVCGFILCTNNLEKAHVAYVNPARLRAQFPQYGNRIYYYTSIAVRPDRQGKQVAQLLVETAGEMMDREDALVVFDYSQEKNPFLADLVAGGLRKAQKREGCTWKSDEIVPVPLGGQQYVALVLKKKSDQ